MATEFTAFNAQPVNTQTASVKPSTNSKKSHRLIIEAELTLHTQVAQGFFYGNKERWGVGRFAGAVWEIRKAASLDDPYADWFLLQIYDALIQSRRTLTEMNTHYQQTLQQLGSLVIKTPYATQPKTIALRFNVTDAYQAAALIGEFDHLVCKVLAAKRLGFVLDQPYYEIIRQAGEQVRQILNKPTKWQLTNVTRKDVQENNEIAQQVAMAFKVLGPLPDVVLIGKVRAPQAPAIKPTSN